MKSDKFGSTNSGSRLLFQSLIAALIELAAGIITQGDLLKAVDHGQSDKTVLEIAATNLVVTYPDETVFDAVAKMLKHNIGRLAVVERQNPKKLLGHLGRANVLSFRRKSTMQQMPHLPA